MRKSAQLIFVDLDGTLVRTDLFAESILRLLKNNPLSIISLVSWLARGIPYAKERVAHYVDIDVEELPLEASLLDYLKGQREQGRRLVLATAAPRKYADKIAAHLGIFDDVLATNANYNMKGRGKLLAIRAAAGYEEFAYAGDSAVLLQMPDRLMDLDEFKWHALA